MLKSQTLNKFITLILLSLTLSACKSTAPINQPVVDISLREVSKTAEQYLSQAAYAQNNIQRDKLTLLAAHAELNQQRIDSADRLLKSLKVKLTPQPELLAEHKLLSAQVFIKRRQLNDALNELNYPSQWRLPSWQWITYHQQKSSLYQQTLQPIKQLAELSLLSKYYSRADAQAINDRIWHGLQPLKQEQLAKLSQQTTEPLFSGWLQLGYIAKHYGADPLQLVSYLSRWQKQHQAHPAARKLPSDLEKALNTEPYQPKQIAVLLPLSGTRATLTDPIRSGILSSYLEMNIPQVSLNFYDTSLGVEAAYQQALSENADFIIGPVLPMNVTKLKQLQAQQSQPNTIPQLFLNQYEGFTADADQYYFSLSPQQEAVDSAMHMHKDGITSPLIFASNDGFGHRMATAYKAQWQQLTGNPADVHFYDAGDKMKLTVQEAMGVKASQARIKQMKAMFGNKIKADFRSRRDIDAIYMISSSQDLSLLKPFIDVNFSVFAQPVPLYSTSRSRPNGGQRRAATEFNGITLSDAPWLMQNTPENRVINTLWPNWTNSQQRLYAMGFDAFSLINKLAQMRAFPGYHLKGHSGSLSIQADGVIYRQLQWGQYRRGYLTSL
ncbi:penicillin-binding protein activator [Parashewanella spongiae]|uniref:Penicillin-binding protein activator n=1 Tax=Parashewanella spongiae TaxID=342950 RepID=A0A3A6U562_9GAMM|nr:penicillin-binding protein activator [Parashewanella spongiae]MCL1078604.1 penicillin-binding protein activator [Parashewanella spongiae]RJY13120.1 penicillin-binding protein activator [Parashewanella spongiae]